MIKAVQCQNDCWDSLQETKQNRKDVRAAQVNTCKQMSDSSGAVGKAPFEQFFSCLLNAGSDDEEMTSHGPRPRERRGNRRGQTCRGDNECGRRRRTQATPRVVVRHALKIVGLADLSLSPCCTSGLFGGKNNSAEIT